MTDNAFTLASPTTPYMIIRGPGDWNNEDGKKAIPITKQDGTFTKDIMVEYVDPIDPTKSFTTDFEDGSVGIAIQGTSSQDYKRKNYKIKLNVFKQNGIVHIKSPNKFGDKDKIYTDNTYTTLKDGYTAAGYKFIDTSIPTFTFCIKADVASSESANNTLLVKTYNEIVKNIELTPPQGDNANIRQGVDGYPMVVWYFNDLTKEYIFLGKYNFNNDKGTEEIYGLEDGDESWEVGNNEKLLCFFDNTEDPTWTNWRTAFETRYPDDDDELTKKGESPYTDEQIADRLAGLKEVVNWVSDSVTWVDSTTKSAVTFNNTVTTADTTMAAATGRTAAAEAFRREFKEHFNMDLMTFFFVYTEFFLMVDNRAKNMFLTRYKVANDRPTSQAWHTNYGDNIVTLPASTSTTDTYAGWFSLPYDMDTGIGTNNVGVYTFDYHYETGDLQPSGEVVFNGQKSKLWVAFAQVFGPEIQAMYSRFQTYITYQALEAQFERHQGVWSETVVNEDMIAKYIDWINYINGEPSTRDSRALPMLLGLKTEQRKWWLENRFKYMNSKYALEASSDSIALGPQGGQLNIPVQVYADSYVTFKVGASDSAPTTIRVRVGETGLIQRTAAATGDGDRIESTLSPASRISAISNLANLNLLNADFSNAIRLQTLRIGSATIINNRLESVGLRSNTLLRLFDLRNCAAYTQDLSVTNCNSLEYIYLGGTNISNVNLPQGGILKTIQYPTSITTINIIKHPYLENIIIGNSLPEDEIQTEEQGNVSVFNGTNDYSNITSITLDGIGPTVEQILADPTQYNTMKPDVAAIIMGSAAGASCSISNIVFYMTGAQFKQLFNRLIAINASVNNCTIILKDALPSDLTVDKIVKQFSGFKVYDQNGNEYYNVTFYDFNRASLIGTISIIGGSGSSIQPDIYKEHFTRQYLNDYNGITDENAHLHETRTGFGGWNADLTNITSDLDVEPLPVTQYRVDFHYLINETTPAIYYDYFAVGDTVTRFDTSTLEFIYNYYKYQVGGWTSDSHQPANYPDDDNREIISGYIIKQSGVESFYAVYQHNTPAPYTIRVFNTNINGEVPENAQPLTTFTKNIVGANHLILPSDLNSYLPSNNNLSVACIGSNESGVAIKNRKYQFLNWNPYIPADGLQVRGDMDINLMYYKTDDYFTNYFINKLVNCNLGTVARIPEGAFNHNFNLRKLAVNTPYIGNYAFCNLNESNAPRRYFTFSGSNIEIGRDAFTGLNNAVIIFDGANAQIVVDQSAFSTITNCIIIVLNSAFPIQRKPNTHDQFNYLGWQNTNNIVYLPEAARAQYEDDNNENIPNKLKTSNVLYYFEEDGPAMETVNALVEEARINDN